MDLAQLRFGFADRLAFETLERRVFLCSTAAELLAAGIPASMVGEDGHIGRTDFQTLSASQQRHVNPHSIDDTPKGPVDFDRILGIPRNLDGVASRRRRAARLLPFHRRRTVPRPEHATRSQPDRLRHAGQQPGQRSGHPDLRSPGHRSHPAGADHELGQPRRQPDRAPGDLQLQRQTASRSRTTATAGTFTYHPGHGHFHFDGYDYYRLRHNVGGQPGAYVHAADGTGIVGEKIGFCLINVSSSFIMENGQSSTTLPGYNAARPARHRAAA